MHTLETLIATYRATIRPMRPWSSSKDYWLTALTIELGQEPLSSLTPERLVAWAGETSRSPQSRRCLLATLSGVLEAGQSLWQCTPHPRAAKDAMRSLQLLGAVASPAQRARRVCDGEIEAIGEAWTSAVPFAAIPCLVDTCLRSGELTRLHSADLDTQRRTIIVRDRKHPSRKLGNHQRIPLLGRSREIIEARARNAQGLIFPYPRKTLAQAFTRASRRAGIEDIRLHDLRHEGISRLFARGWTIPQVAAVSGHRSWENLRRYTHITPEQLLELDT